jgi:hypothetical protein
MVNGNEVGMAYLVPVHYLLVFYKRLSTKEQFIKRFGMPFAVGGVTCRLHLYHAHQHHAEGSISNTARDDLQGLVQWLIVAKAITYICETHKRIERRRINSALFFSA